MSCDCKFPTPGPLSCYTEAERLKNCFPPGFLFTAVQPDGTVIPYMGDGHHGKRLAFYEDIKTIICEVIEEART